MLTLAVKGKDLFWVGSDFGHGEFQKADFMEDFLAVRGAEIWKEQPWKVISALSLEVCKPELRLSCG